MAVPRQRTIRTDPCLKTNYNLKTKVIKVLHVIPLQKYDMREAKEKNLSYHAWRI